MPPASRDYLTLFDTTLRDGAQTTGVDFSLADKRAVAALLDDLGLDYIEGGYPGANPLDTAFFADPPRLRAKLAAFGMTKRAGRSPSNDPGLVATLEASADAIVFVAKTWDYHVHVALGCTLDENVASITQSVRAARERGREALVDCEHFFDGYKANPDYALRCAVAAHEAGARWIVCCDTNGGTLPDEVEHIVGALTRHITGSHVGIHAHNDTEHAVANSLAAVRAGARQIQGTLNGIGERCGNANLVSLIPTLLLKPAYADHLAIGIPPEKLAALTKLSHAFDELMNRVPFRHAPYVGDSAFATKAGIHASAVVKDTADLRTCGPGGGGEPAQAPGFGPGRQIEPPGRIGTARRRGSQGRSARRSSARRGEGPRVARLRLRGSGCLLRPAGAADPWRGAALLRRRALQGKRRAPLQCRRAADHGIRRRSSRLRSMARASCRSPKARALSTALDLALRKDLGKYQRHIQDLELLDYRVRIFQGGSDAVTRVLIECGDRDGERWTTVGVSANIIDASFQALVDAITYKLMKAAV